MNLNYFQLTFNSCNGNSNSMHRAIATVLQGMGTDTTCCHDNNYYKDSLHSYQNVISIFTFSTRKKLLPHHCHFPAALPLCLTKNAFPLPLISLVCPPQPKHALWTSLRCTLSLFDKIFTHPLVPLYLI